MVVGISTMATSFLLATRAIFDGSICRGVCTPTMIRFEGVECFVAGGQLDAEGNSVLLTMSRWFSGNILIRARMSPSISNLPSNLPSQYAMRQYTINILTCYRSELRLGMRVDAFFWTRPGSFENRKIVKIYR